MSAARRWTALLPSCERALVPLGVVALAYYGISIGVEKLYQRQSMRSFEIGASERSAAVPSGATPLSLAGDVLGFKEPLGRLEIPSIDLDVIVLEGTGSSDLNRGVGHIAGTSPLGGGGNVGIAGHRDGFFRDLRSVSKGDRVLVTTRGGRSTYRVREVRVVSPEDVHVLDREGESRLTLVTCYPFGYLGPAPKRFVVLADLSS